MSSRALSAANRGADLVALTSKEFDLLVVGGGVVGAGAALDAVTRGLSVGLVEAQDWASGTSSRSTKLVHGGLRYLRLFGFYLVHEALKERALLPDRIAPHLVTRMPFLYPLRRRVYERAYSFAGISLYDALGWSTRSSRRLPRQRQLSRRRVYASHPGLRPDLFVGGIEYYDAQVDDARFVVTLVGGASNNRWLMQFQSDVTGIPVDVAADIETTSLGAAYLAGITLGIWRGLHRSRRAP